MSKKKTGKFRDAAHEIDLGLNGLFGALGEAIEDIVTRLDDGNTGSVQRDHVFETPKGPVRAQAGIRIRMGGHDIATPKPNAPRPMNPDRAKQAAPAPRDLSYDVLEDNDSWILTADAPGVMKKDLDLSQIGKVLRIKTEGARRYQADVTFDADFNFVEIKTTLKNGILTLHVPKSMAP